MATVVAAFPRLDSVQRLCAQLDRLKLPYETISPEPAYGRVGVPALVLECEDLGRAVYAAGPDMVCSGCVEHRPFSGVVPSEPPPIFEEDIFDRAAVMVLAPCVADPSKIRLIAHLSGELTPALPYFNAVERTACYNRHGPSLVFLEGHRMISLYPRRIAVAKADDIIDGWRTLEMIRRRLNEVWAHRTEIEPSYAMRERPNVLEVYKRLPRTNCRQCGHPTCLAFAVLVLANEASLTDCKPIYNKEFGHLREAVEEVCRGYGLKS